ncbi:MAG: EAL domain-containing protein [Romboutsia sp.]
MEFNEALILITPFILVISTFSILHFIMINIFGNVNFQQMFTDFISNEFTNHGRTLYSALLFMFVRQVMWFLGIHGGNVMHTTAVQVFEEGMKVNIQLLSENMLPTEIFTKTFFDTMTLFGGSGSLLCFILAVLIVSKKKSMRKIIKVATLPAIFNMNEILIFGVPIVLNPILFVPFILTPMVLIITSYTAMKTGLVPYATSPAQWTTPIFISGYIVTGSIRGSLLQLFNLIIGTLLYIPFVKLLEARDFNKLKLNINNLINLVKQCESKGEDTNLLDSNGKIGEISKILLDDLDYAIKNKEIKVYYQPQVNYNGEIIGVEALLRWNHSTVGNMYPPLVISLAKEGKILNELSDYILDESCRTLQAIQKMFNSNIKMSVNICAEQLNSMHTLPEQIESKILKYNINPYSLGIEITEHSALQGGILVKEKIKSIRKLKVFVIMDDFGMGHNSLLYLKNHDFDIVKIDGSLVREILINEISREILSTIVQLSQTLNFDTIVEYVETKEQVEVLKHLGCENYQGYYYSEPLPYNELIKYLNENINNG